jgi:DNA polymerase
MNEQIRRQYLQRMGIRVWEPREIAIDLSSDTVTNHDGENRVVPGVQRRESIATLDWQSLQDSVASCTACDLHTTRTNTVFGSGNPDAQLMIIGEAPGAEEDRQGLPFVGRAGQLLTEMLAAIGFKRDEVFIANTLKCRPPNNRDPQSEEVAQCEPFLLRQVELIQPKIILALGRIAAHNVLKTQESLARLRTQPHAFHNTSIPVYVSYHPAYLLRSPGEKRKAWEDLKKVKMVLGH